MLHEVNPFVRDFVQIAEFEDGEHENVHFVINPAARPQNEHARVHNLNLHEVAVLFNETPQANDIVVRRRGGGLSIIADTHRAFDPLHFVLLFPLGSHGWHIRIPQRFVISKSFLIDVKIMSVVFRNCERMITKLQFHCFHLHERLDSFNYLLCAERLLQEYICVSFATIENLRLQFAKYNQDILRSEVLSNLQDAMLASDGDSRVGKRIICPRSVYNSQRNRFCR